MLPLSDAVKVKPVGSVEALTPTTPVADARQEVFERSIQRLIGEQLQGEVLSRLKDGTFLVNVAGTTTRMALPDGAQTGTSIAMTLVSIQPRPTFLLGATAPGTSPTSSSSTQISEAALKNLPLVYADASAKSMADENAITKGANGSANAFIENYVQTANLLRAEQYEANPLSSAQLQNAETTAAQLAAKSSSSAPASLSATGQLINFLLRNAQENNAPTTLLGKTPILSAPTAPPEKIAASLHEALSSSGLFYESHVADWAEGKRTMADLMREPQMQLNLANHAQLADANLASQADTRGNELAQIINLQLNSLEHQNTQWRGEVWPGQPMEWDVSKDDSPDANDNGDDPQSWQSSVRFNFPLLGAVSATIHLHGEHLQIQISTNTENAAESLRAHAGVLADSLAATGTALDSITVKQNDRP